MRFILRHPAARDRRTLLRFGVSVLSGLALMVLWDQVKGVLRVAGAARRFTGSYETGSFDGSFPVVAWIADRQPAVEAASWLLAIRGAVKAPLDLSLPELKSLPQVEVVATLDCTGGWYTTQVWEGVPLGVLLQRAGLSAEARSVTVRSITGYQRRYPIEEAKGFLLALGVAHNPLGRGHGFPVRLVAPGRRGFDWVKWVQEVQINETDAAWQSPLPLQ